MRTEAKLTQKQVADVKNNKVVDTAIEKYCSLTPELKVIAKTFIDLITQRDLKIIFKIVSMPIVCGRDAFFYCPN